MYPSPRMRVKVFFLKIPPLQQGECDCLSNSGGGLFSPRSAAGSLGAGTGEREGGSDEGSYLEECAVDKRFKVRDAGDCDE